MKYALTFTNPETYGWNETNTILIECNKNPLDIGLDDLAKVLSDFTGGDFETAKATLGNESWYIRNCDDTDATIFIDDSNVVNNKEGSDTEE